MLTSLYFLLCKIYIFLYINTFDFGVKCDSFCGIHSNDFAGQMLMHVLKTVKGHISLFFNHTWCCWCKRQFPAHIGCFRTMTSDCTEGEGRQRWEFYSELKWRCTVRPRQEIKQHITIVRLITLW